MVSYQECFMIQRLEISSGKISKYDKWGDQNRVRT